MRFSLSFIALVAPLLVSAAPARHYGKRAAADVLVFKFADVLEQLESGFYQAALAKFKEADFTTAGFASPSVPIEQMKVMAFDEATHSTALQAALKSFGEEPITGCKFNFEPVLADLATTLATARVVENVGVGAYLGGATLITDPILLDAAGSILSIEARHSSVLNILSAGGAIPSAFDVPLTPSEVLALAGGFIDPSAPCDVGIPANPALKITNTGPAAVGTKLTFESPAINGTVTEDKLFCNMMLGGAPISISLPMSECVVPEGTNGPVYIWVTSDAQPLVNNAVNRATDKLIAGPALAFIDSVPEAIGTSLRSGGAAPASGGDGAVTTSTQTISPAEASSIIAGAAPTAAPGGATDKANQATGPTTDGAITVKGYTNLPSGAR